MQPTEQQSLIRLKVLSLGVMGTNCYVLANPAGDALVIDPAGDPEVIGKYLESEELTPAAILLTHAHFDHIQAVPDLAAKYDLPVVLHPEDEFILASPDNAMPPMIPAIRACPPTIPELVDQPAGLHFEMLHTPGHSPGSVSYYFPALREAFVGDTLFCRGIGRDDLWGGDHATLIASIRNVLLALDDRVQVYPGHGPDTTIALEKQQNPFLR